MQWADMLRLFNKTDLQDILRIEELGQVAPWTADIFERCWDAGYRGWVIEKEARVVGFIVVSFQAGEAHILNLGVHPDFQRQGHAEELLKQVLVRAKAQNVSTAFLEVRRSNVKAIALYEKMDFVQIGERKQYYPALKGREDALTFAKDLTI
jgi:ribosomal-protein-alanine N-acetyltransferase